MRKEDCYYEDNFYDVEESESCENSFADKKPFLLIFLIFIVAGVFFGLVGILIGKADANTKELCTDEVLATVTGLRMSENDDRTVIYTPVFEYEYDGYTYESITHTYSNTFEDKFRMGSTLTIFVNPDKPTQIYCDEIGATTNVLGIFFECFGFGVAILFLILEIKTLIFPLNNKY